MGSLQHQAPVTPDHIEHIFIVTGPAGCGKTTVAQYLAQQLSWPYIEGDDVSRFRDYLSLTNPVSVPYCFEQGEDGKWYTFDRLRPMGLVDHSSREGH